MSVWRRSSVFLVILASMVAMPAFGQTGSPRFERPPHQNLVTSYVNAEKIGFLRIPRGAKSDWHPAPSKRFVMVLSGLLEVAVGDGERRTFEPGNVLLVTDAQGRGHLTNVLGNQDVFLVWVPVP